EDRRARQSSIGGGSGKKAPGRGYSGGEATGALEKETGKGRSQERRNRNKADIHESICRAINAGGVQSSDARQHHFVDVVVNSLSANATGKIKSFAKFMRRALQIKFRPTEFDGN